MVSNNYDYIQQVFDDYNKHSTDIPFDEYVEKYVINEEEHLIFNDIKLWLYSRIEEYSSLFIDKEKMTQEQINRISSLYMEKFYNTRLQYRELVKESPTLYILFYLECRKSFLFWILWEGVTKDIQRNKKAKVQPVIPYKYQLELINELQYGKINILVEKSRRMGISLIFTLHNGWIITFGTNNSTFHSHKDLASLDKKGDYTNSTFGRIRLLLKNSMFVPHDLFNNVNKNPFAEEEDTYKIEEKRIVIGPNSVEGLVAGPDMGVGGAYTEGYVDEIAVVEDKYANSSNDILGSFSSNTVRTFLFSTHRGITTNFYKLVKQNDILSWKFFKFHYSQHPLINKEWVENVKAVMKQDKVLIARELEIQPEASIEGVIWYYISKDNEVDPSDYSDWIKFGKRYIFADQPGGVSPGSLIFAYFYKNVLYCHDCYQQSRIDEHLIKKNIELRPDFIGIPINMDVAGKSTAQSVNRDWFSLLRNVGIVVKPVDNTGVYEWNAITNYMFLQKNIVFNKNCSTFDNFKAYRMKKDGEIDKGEASNTADALRYGVKTIWPKSTIGFID